MGVHWTLSIIISRPSRLLKLNQWKIFRVFQSSWVDPNRMVGMQITWIGSPSIWRGNTQLWTGGSLKSIPSMLCKLFTGYESSLQPSRHKHFSNFLKPASDSSIFVLDYLNLNFKVLNSVKLIKELSHEALRGIRKVLLIRRELVKTNHPLIT